MDKTDRLKIFSGNANRKLAEEITQYLNIEMGKGDLGRFSDGEISSRIKESVRGADIYLVQPLCHPVNENIMELLIMIDALRRASAKSVTAVVPYFAYARQDRKTKAREPITAKLLADLITAAGASRFVAMDLHAGQIQGFFNIPSDHLTAVPILAKYFQQKNIQNGVVVSPDLGGVTRARELADRLAFPIAVIDKKRVGPNKAEVMQVIGDVRNKVAVMIDDIIDTGGTICQGAKILVDNGVRAVYACCTHPVFSGPALKNLKDSPFTEVVYTNTIPVKDDNLPDNFKVLSVAPLIGEAIRRIHQEQSVSELFD